MTRSALHPLAEDLDRIVAATAPLWEALRGDRLFLTGGTGFAGCWLLESFLWANRTLGLDAEVDVLTRDPAAFRAKAPHLAEDPAVSLLAGNVCALAPAERPYAAVIHAAADADAARNAADPAALVATIVEGTRRALDFARSAGARHVLFFSSGAVYGPQPPEVSHLPETFLGGPDPLDVRAAYGESKRLAELLCALAAQAGLPVSIARGFAFLGPYLPLDRHFAAGNFLRDALAGTPIRIQGDGTPERSYLYAADMAIWLWTMLFRGTPGRAYNVGSEAAVSIRALAEAIARQHAPALPVQVAQAPVVGRPIARYVPSTARAQGELGLSPGPGLDEQIARTLSWHRSGVPI